jgi:hypothetical protein
MDNRMPATLIFPAASSPPSDQTGQGPLANEADPELYPVSDQTVQYAPDVRMRPRQA